MNWWYTILGVLVAWGIVAYVWELERGLAVTGMRDVVSWGSYIFTFAFFVGLSAGGLIMASSAEVFGIDALKPLSRLGVLSAAGSILIAALLIVPDLGRPDRIFNLVLHPNWTSPLTWDIIIVTTYLIFSFVDLYILHEHYVHPTKWGSKLRLIAFIGLPLAVLLHSITGWIFGLQISRTFWNTALMAPLFVTSAILSGTALVTLIALAAERYGSFALPDQTKKWLRGFITVALFIDLFFVASDYITTLWGHTPAALSSLKLILPGGSWSWTFWTEWVIGGVIPLCLMLIPRLRQMKGSLGFAAAFVIIGVFAFRIELVVVGLVNPLLLYPPGNALGTYDPSTTSFQMVGHYTPTWVECGVVIGLVALFCAIITYGYRKLELWRDGVGKPSGLNTEREMVGANQ